MDAPEGPSHDVKPLHGTLLVLRQGGDLLLIRREKPPYQGLLALRNQIQNGVTDEDLEMEVGTSNLTFYDDGGNPVTYNITGSPGLDGGLTDAIESQIGNVVGFFLHTNVVLSGSNAMRYV